MVKAGVLSDTRIRILKLLLLEDSSPGLISNRLGIKEFAIRRHLDILEKEGLVAPSLRKTGDVGHPLKVYSLTKKGRKLEIFPNQQKNYSFSSLKIFSSDMGENLSFLFSRTSQKTYQGSFPSILRAKILNLSVKSLQ
jgi:predicted ArsR family transcriptional regulator